MLRKGFLVVLLLLTACGCGQKSDTKVIDADFDTAMGKDSRVWHEMIAHAGNRERLEILKSVYESSKPSNVTSEKASKIPKCIHQIWVGPKPLPTYFWKYRRSWKEKHPDWKYQLWTDKEVAELDFELKDLYLSSTNWGEKSDILRAELLDMFGGLYVDIDCEGLKAFDELHMKYDFFAGLEPPHQGDMTQQAPHLVISDALVAARPGHPIIKEWKALIRAKWDYYGRLHPDGAKRTLLRTFFPFGQATVKHLADPDQVNIVFPSTYFFPLTFSRVSKGRIKKLGFFKRTAISLSAFFDDKKTIPFIEVQPETMSVHYWGNSWVKSGEERLREMHCGMLHLQRQVDELKEELAEMKRVPNNSQ